MSWRSRSQQAPSGAEGDFTAATDSSSSCSCSPSLARTPGGHLPWERKEIGGTLTWKVEVEGSFFCYHRWIHES